ncbi:MAG: glycine cleavage system aminomethyltransferase GcvT [Aeromicrobium sp.]|nr:MAG: glycine cleavage system aminomethyltransferase GcvT [Aeromicrobium sp.]
MSLLTSPLHERHEELGAKFAEFGGWSMPLEYAGGGVLAEHQAVREGVGVFDVSHLGKVTVRGAGAAEFINRCFTNDLAKIPVGKAQYTLACAEDGGTIDDLIAYLKADDDVFLIPNAANTPAVVALLQAKAPAGIEIIDQHRDFAVIAVQGTKSDEVLEALGLATDHEYMSFVSEQLGGAEITVCRTGYTGERGYELVVKSEDALAVWDRVMAAGEVWGVRVCGLGARDTLRTEMGYPLHGNDLSPEISPVMARAGWAVGWNKPEFWGREALIAQKEAKTSRLLRGIKATGRGIPRHDMTVVSTTGQAVGVVTSGTFSPTLREGIGLALLDRSVAVGDVVNVEVRGKLLEFDVVAPPFVQPSTKES